MKFYLKILIDLDKVPSKTELYSLRNIIENYTRINIEELSLMDTQGKVLKTVEGVKK
jgi:hypothetical protein